MYHLEPPLKLPLLATYNVSVIIDMRTMVLMIELMNLGLLEAIMAQLYSSCKYV